MTILKLAATLTWFCHCTVHSHCWSLPRKRTARWVSILPSTAQKDERVQRTEDFLQLFHQGLLAVLDNIATPSYPSTPLNWGGSQSSGTRKGIQALLGPKCTLQGWSKQSSSSSTPRTLSILTMYVPGQNRYHLLHQDCPGQIPEGFQRDLPIMSSQDWSLGWDNAAIHIKWLRN